MGVSFLGGGGGGISAELEQQIQDLVNNNSNDNNNDTGVSSPVTDRVSGLFRIGNRFTPDTAPLALPSTITLGQDLNQVLAKYPDALIRFKVADDIGNRGWDVAELDLALMIANSENASTDSLIHVHNDDFIVVNLTNLSTGEITLSDNGREVSLLYVEIVSFVDQSQISAAGTTDNADTSQPPAVIPEIGVFPNTGFVSGSKPLQSQILAINSYRTVQYTVPTVGSEFFDGEKHTAPAKGIYYYDCSAVFGNDTVDTNAGLSGRFLINEGLATERIVQIRREVNPLGVAGIYGVHGSAPISLQQGDTVRFQAGQLDNSTSDNPNTSFTNTANFTALPFDISLLPMGHFDIVFLGDETQAEFVYAELIANQVIPIGAGSVELGAPFSIEGIQIDTQGSIVNGSFVSRFGGAYKFDFDLLSQAAIAHRGAINLRVNRTNGTTETYHNVNVTNRGGVSGTLDRDPINGQDLIRLAAGESVDFFAHVSRNTGTTQLNLGIGSTVSIIRVSDSNTYVNAYDTRSDRLAPQDIIDIVGGTELEDVQNAYSAGEFTAPTSGPCFFINKLAVNGGGAVPPATMVLKRDGVIFDYRSVGGYTSTGSHFNVYTISRMIHVQENEVITATIAFAGWNEATFTGINEIHPTAMVGNNTDIYGAFQATFVTNDAPPVPVLPPAPATNPDGTPVFLNADTRLIQHGTDSSGGNVRTVTFETPYANAEYSVAVTSTAGTGATPADGNVRVGTVLSKTTTGFSIRVNNTNIDFDWIAVGEK